MLFVVRGCGGEDRFDQGLRHVRRNRIVGRRLGQQHGLLVRLQVRHARWADREMSLEFRTLMQLQFVISIPRDELDELLARDVGPGQGNLPLDVER